jgi:hypothetical protein
MVGGLPRPASGLIRAFNNLSIDVKAFIPTIYPVFHAHLGASGTPQT